MGSLSEDDVAEAYRRLFPIILRKSRRMLRGSSDAQDLAQETFLRLWRSRLDLRDAAATTAWLYRTSTRLALDRLRSVATRAEGSEALAEAIASPASSAEERSHYRRLLIELSESFSSETIEAVVLARLDGLNHREIGQVLDMSERKVRRLLARFDLRVTGWRARRQVIA